MISEKRKVLQHLKLLVLKFARRIQITPSPIEENAENTIVFTNRCLQAQLE